MHYILREKTDNGRVDRIQSSSLEEAVAFFIKRKQMDEETFHKLFFVELDE
jgi:uncharacterized protein YheU (UPF0270 family)|tara:strand:- start:285 stop:437 length:153 start_codon:yes stop_codon:yes gene_type:complete